MSNKQYIKPIERPSWMQQCVSSMQEFASISQVMRIIGAIIMTTSLSVFLIQGWEVGNDSMRYLQLLVHTLLLAASGFALHRWLQENKGARMFFSLCLIAIVANFTILGALVYSVVQWDGRLGAYPDIAQWVSEASTLGITLAGSAVILIPLTLLVFSILARRSRKLLSIGFLVANLSLLIPVREAWMIGVLAMAVLALVLIIYRALKSDHTMQTQEGRFARFMLIVPAGILMARSMIFYGIDDLVLFLIASMIYFLLREIGKGLNMSHLGGAISLIASVPVALFMSAILLELLALSISWSMQSLLFAAIYAGLSFDLYQRAGKSVIRNVIAYQAVLFSGAAAMFALFAGGSLEGVLLLVAAVLMVIVGYYYASKLLRVTGLGLLALTLFRHVDGLLSMVDFGNWVAMAILGGVIIISASVLDRHGARLKLMIASRKQTKLIV